MENEHDEPTMGRPRASCETEDGIPKIYSERGSIATTVSGLADDECSKHDYDDDDASSGGLDLAVDHEGVDRIRVVEDDKDTIETIRQLQINDTNLSEEDMEEEDFEHVEVDPEVDSPDALAPLRIPVFRLLCRKEIIADCQQTGVPLPRSLLKPVQVEADEAESKARLSEIQKSVKTRRKSMIVGVAGGLNPLRALVSKKKKRFTEMGFNLDLTYLTERLIAMGFPAEKKTEKMFRNTIGETVRFLESFHRDQYAVYNLCSERTYNPERFHNRVFRFPFDDHEAPTLRLMVEFCAQVDDWMKAHPENIAAVHCKAGKGRTGVMLSAFLVYSGEFDSAVESLKYYDFVRTENSKGVTIPSQRRFVHYFDKLVARKFSFEGLDVYKCLQTVRIMGVPRVTRQGSAPYFRIRIGTGEVIDSRTFLKVQPYDKDGVSIDFHCPELHFKEEMRFELYHEETALCHFWIHVGFIENNFLELEKREIDAANKDKSHKIFPSDFAIQMFWCASKLHDGINPDMRAWTMTAST